MNETQTNDDVSEDKSSERYFELSDLLDYTFKMPFAYGSRVVWLKFQGRLLPRRTRISPIAYRGEYHMFGFGGVVSSHGGARPFVWMTDDGTLVVYDEGFKATTLGELSTNLGDSDYELLVLWLSNDAQGAQALIGKQFEARVNELADDRWPDISFEY